MLYTSNELTKIAESIFGKDIIRSVHVEGMDNSIKLKKLDQIVAESKDGELHYHNCTIIVAFINGNIVEFENSEWATIKRLNE